MDKYDYINAITSFLRGHTASNFQFCVKEVLKAFYDYKKKNFIMPDSYGGDYKNDGWVKQDAVFYQIYSPTRLKTSLKKDIQNKFCDDLDGLLTNLKKGNWNGQINKFIFVVNTFDNNLPPDNDNFFEVCVKSLSQKYGFKFTHEVVNVDYLFDLLCEVNDIHKLEILSAKLNVRNYPDPNAITEKIMVDFVEEVSGRIIEKFFKNAGKPLNEYTRISTPEKISINSLENKRAEIENVLLNLDVVDSAVSNINQDILFTDKFNRVKEHIINMYKNARENFKGDELYEKLISGILEYVENSESKEIPAKFLVIYIFDKCDIFEKEKSESL
ncbi:MAG: hypothetical protein LBS21_12895 [Clostridiales bacterium]|jgi:hypothetical protein|nr:hypothetical protein [Clostridiales bacterium]